MTQTEALKIADDLDSEFAQGRISNHTGRKAAQMLRALAQPEQEPVYQIKVYGSQTAWHDAGSSAYDLTSPNERRILYTTSPQRTWIGLTTDEYDAAIVMDSIEAAVTFVEAKLKEKNT